MCHVSVGRSSMKRFSILVNFCACGGDGKNQSEFELIEIISFKIIFKFRPKHFCKKKIIIRRLADCEIQFLYNFIDSSFGRSSRDDDDVKMRVGCAFDRLVECRESLIKSNWISLFHELFASCSFVYLIKRISIRVERIAELPCLLASVVGFVGCGYGDSMFTQNDSLIHFKLKFMIQFSHACCLASQCLSLHVVRVQFNVAIESNWKIVVHLVMCSSAAVALAGPLNIWNLTNNTSSDSQHYRLYIEAGGWGRDEERLEIVWIL